MKQYNWYAVMGITTTESATPTTEDKEKTSPYRLYSHIWGWTTVTTFIFRDLYGNVGDKMKQVGYTGWVIIMVLLTVVLQLFRELPTMVLTSREEGGRSLVEFNSGQRNQRRVLVCEFL
jgi:hypothetical protein